MREYELVIIGAGPAGLSAAIEAARAGVDVLICDENSMAGGQLFKQIHKFFGSRAHKAGTRGIDIGTYLLEEVKKSGAEVRLEAVVWGIFSDKRVGIVQKEKNTLVKAKKFLFPRAAPKNV